MYVPTAFTDQSPEFFRSLLTRYPLATVVVQSEDGLLANHIPLIWRAGTPGYGVLCGHVARANPLMVAAAYGVRCLTVFQGVGGYISPNNYATKSTDKRVVPTWNYEAIHVQGHLRLVEDVSWLEQLLIELTAEHEATQLHPWRLEQAPRDYIEKLLGAIVGIEIQIDRWIGKAKLSQNQPPENRISVITALHSEGTSTGLQLAATMAARASNHSPNGGGSMINHTDRDAPKGTHPPGDGLPPRPLQS